MIDMDKDLQDILREILKEYDCEGGPLFKLAPKLRLHSAALAYKDSYLEKEKFYIEETVKKSSHIFRHLNIKVTYSLFTIMSIIKTLKKK